MAEDLFKGVNYNDGEDVVFGDFNDQQRFLSSRLFDQVIEKLICAPTQADPEFVAQAGANAPTVWAYALSVGGGNPRQGSANNKIKIGAGTLLQKIAAATGNEPQLLAYTFDGTTEVALANGDPANPRVDLIQMSLAYVTDDLQARDFQDAVTGANSSQNVNKKRRVQCTVNVKQGVAAASPVYPTPDAGFVPIAFVVVGTNYVAAAGLKYVDTAGAVAVLHDVRMPVGVTPQHTRPLECVVNAADGTWTLSAGATRWQAVGTGQMYVPCRPIVGRLCAVALMSAGGVTTAASHKLLQHNLDTGVQFVADVSLLGSAAQAYKQMAMTAIEAHAIFAAGPTVLGNGTHSPPIWTNGKRAPDEHFFLAAGGLSVDYLAMYFNGATAGEWVYGVTFWIAEGL